MLAGVMLLGGVLPLSHGARDHWAPAGAWRHPVGEPYALSIERPADPGPFFVLRGLERDGERVQHQGADVGCGLAGGPVRAAAAGLVVRVADHGDHGGYGTHVVLAHRIAGGTLAYSVYAHLKLASVRVRPGQFVPAGTTLGRVGMTGRATTPHLHFEVRTARDPGERWERAGVEDPLAFVETRLPAHRGDTSGVAAYLEWAEFAALLPAEAQGDDVLSRTAWWRMLAAAGHGTLADPGLPAEALRDSLAGAGVLPSAARKRAPGQAVDWDELAADLGRLRRHGTRGGSAPFRRERHRRLMAAHLGDEAPARHAAGWSERAGRPSLTDAVLLLADLRGPAPEPPAPKPAKPVAKRRPARADSLARGGGGAARADSAASRPRRAPSASPTSADTTRS